MRLAVLCLALLPTAALAVGGNSPVNKPKPTETSETCEGVQVWDPDVNECVDPKESSLDEDQLGEAVRELAYAGRNADAQGILQVMQDQKSDLVLTYWGFTHRRLGNTAKAMAYYDEALSQNPDNLLARSYLGQAHVEAGRLPAAKEQLKEIRARGGTGLWPEIALSRAIRDGRTTDY